MDPGFKISHYPIVVWVSYCFSLLWLNATSQGLYLSYGRRGEKGKEKAILTDLVMEEKQDSPLLPIASPCHYSLFLLNILCFPVHKNL
jgi:hypothetical protein